MTHSTAAALHQAHDPGELCHFCGEQHKPWRCSTLQQTERIARDVLIKNSGLCFCCLRKGHCAASCKFLCKKCGTGHNAFCCLNSGSASTSLCSNSSSFQTNVVLLQTARVCVDGRKGKAEATVLFDSGSDTSYITSSLAAKTGLKWLGSRQTSYTSFGGLKSQQCQRDVYKVSVSKLGSSDAGRVATFDAVSIPSICAQLPRRQLPSGLLASLRDLDLADP